MTDFPYKPHYHDPENRVPSLSQNPNRQYLLDEVVAKLEKNEYDLLVLSTSRHETIDIFEKLESKVKLPPRVLMDGDDHSHIQKDLFKRFGLDLYFKREYPLSWRQDSLKGRASRWYEFGRDQMILKRIFPLPFSSTLETMPRSDDPVLRKDVDLSFVGHVSHRVRLKTVNFLKNIQDIRFEGWVYAAPMDRTSKLATGAFSILKEKIKGDPKIPESKRGVKLGYDQYFDLLKRSKVALSIRGGGFDTLRYWEIVAAKVPLISEKPFIAIPNNFEHKKHVLFCRSDYRDVPELVKTYIRDDALRQKMTDAAYEHLLSFHTCEKRAAYFMDVCRKNI